MKKLSQILAVAAILLAPFAISTGVGATTYTCQTDFTGPDSNNICTSTTRFECTANNQNTIAIVTDNTQNAVSGTVDLVGNASGGSAGSGTANNDNNLTFNVTVTNTTVGDAQHQVCAVVATVPATPEVTPTPTPVVTTTKAAPKVLPNTNSDATAGFIVTLAALLGIGAISAFLFTKAYSRK
jgi:hypothetical protein